MKNMKDAKEVLRNSYERILMEKINGNGGHVESPDDIWVNLRYLATSYMNYGEEKLVMPLQIKKILAYILDPDYRIEYEVVRTDKDCTVTASFYWSGSDTPAGRGFVKRYINQIFPNDSLSFEERDSIFEPTVRGLAATRAITDAGIAMQFYADSLDMLEPEMTEADRNKAAKTKVPEVQSNNDRAKEALQEKSKNRGGTHVPPQTVSSNEPQTAPNMVTGQTEKISSEVAGDLSDLFSDASQGMKDMPSADEINWAREIMVDIGRFKGYPLKSLIDGDKLNGIAWLSRNASGDVKRAASILMQGDPRFDKLL